MLKKLLSSPVVQVMIAWPLAAYMRFCCATTRWDVHGAEHVEAAWASKEGLVITFWHGRIALSFAGWKKGVQTPAMLISRSREGDFIALFARFLDIVQIRGSSRDARTTKSKGELPAFREMIRHVERGGVMGLTPDGPRGPRMRMQMGPLRLARATGARILPYAWSVSRRRALSSWDRFYFPFPFAKGVIVWGEPVWIAADAGPADLETARALLEERLNAATREADFGCGVEAVEPGEPRRRGAPSEAPA